MLVSQMSRQIIMCYLPSLLCATVIMCSRYYYVLPPVIMTGGLKEFRRCHGQKRLTKKASAGDSFATCGMRPIKDSLTAYGELLKAL